ncbi:MAG: hypothetical protein HC892_22675, partial [Saprospiraceae bacterium]|nr:hypothetical protein [Saprospiraceae bacterium]
MTFTRISCKLIFAILLFGNLQAQINEKSASSTTRTHISLPSSSGDDKSSFALLESTAAHAAQWHDLSLLLVAIEEGQTALQAIRTNVPWIDSRSGAKTFLPYPVGVTPLKVGGKYAWQVSAYENGQYVGQTSIWEFTYQQMDNLAVVPPIETY